ncbi:protein disulfide-isomerase A3 precursor, partial [Reticulomyxa filosa]
LEDRNQWLLHMCEVIYASERNKLEMKRRSDPSEYQRISLQLDARSKTSATIGDEMKVTSSNRVTRMSSRPEPAEKEKTDKDYVVTERMSQWTQPTSALLSQDWEATQDDINSVQKEILAKIKNSKLTATSQGIDFYSILQLMRNRFTSKNANELQMHLQQLVDIGYLFNTYDKNKIALSKKNLFLGEFRTKNAAKQDFVKSLNKSSFADFVSSHKRVLVEFYTPWCEHCKAMQLEFEKTAKHLQKDGAETEDENIKYLFEGDLTNKNELQEWIAKQDLENIVGKDKHIFVDFYAPWCEHSKRLELEYDKVVMAFSNSQHIIIAKMDVMQNDCSQKIQPFPTLISYPKGSKKWHS